MVPASGGWRALSGGTDYKLSKNKMDEGCGAMIFYLVVIVVVVWILYAVGGWVLSTFGIVGLVIFILLIAGGSNG
jgi:hypothetical protein